MRRSLPIKSRFSYSPLSFKAFLRNRKLNKLPIQNTRKSLKMSGSEKRLIQDAAVDNKSATPEAWELMIDQLEAMFLQEKTKYNLSSSDQERCELEQVSFVDGGDLDVCRRKMCEWAFNVVDYFDFSRDLVSISLNHVDRFMEIVLESDGRTCKKRFQSISVTSLYLTLKLQGMSSGRIDLDSGKKRLLSIKTFVGLSRGILSMKSLEEEERIMMKGLGYMLNPPTVSHLFCNAYDFSHYLRPDFYFKALTL